MADLAGEAGVSRALLAKRFNEIMGEPPLTYLTEWRMQLAEELHATPISLWPKWPARSATPTNSASATPSNAEKARAPPHTEKRLAWSRPFKAEPQVTCEVGYRTLGTASRSPDLGNELVDSGPIGKDSP